jgi:hypothetical protein
MYKKLSKMQAKRLSNEIRDGLVVTAQKIEMFINGQGWIALGHSSFEAWWNAEHLSDTLLGREIRPIIVIQMIENGMSDMEVSLKVKGVSPSTVSNIRRQKEIGIPHDKITVRQHSRKTPPSKPSVLKLDLGPRVLARYRKAAEAEGLSLEKIAISLLREHFR